MKNLIKIVIRRRTRLILNFFTILSRINLLIEFNTRTFVSPLFIEIFRFLINSGLVLISSDRIIIYSTVTVVITRSRQFLLSFIIQILNVKPLRIWSEILFATSHNEVFIHLSVIQNWINRSIIPSDNIILIRLLSWRLLVLFNVGDI